MYCPSCGAQLTQEMSYCNRCGANLRSTSNLPAISPPKFVGAVWAISIAVVLITLGGFGMLFGLIMALITRGFSISKPGVFLIFCALMVILAIAWLLVQQLSRLLSMPQLTGETVQPRIPKLSEKPALQVSAPREPVPSVTENTTRTLESVYREQNTRG